MVDDGRSRSGGIALRHHGTSVAGSHRHGLWCMDDPFRMAPKASEKEQSGGGNSAARALALNVRQMTEIIAPMSGNPYDPPLSESIQPGLSDPTITKSALLLKISRFVSPAGTFSRVELLIATLGIVVLAIAISFIASLFQSQTASLISSLLIYCLYPVWGIALGKRSRDLGTTFTYGMIIGMIFPIMGLVFLFQPGKKALSRNHE